MPNTITGNPATGHGNPISFSGPASGDAIASGAMDTALQALADLVARFQSQGAQLDTTNTFTQSVIFSAAVTLSAALTANGNVALNASALQSVLKGGTGKLDIGTSTANDVEFLVGNVVKAILRSSDGKLQGQSTAGGDSGVTLTSKDYVDGAHPLLTNNQGAPGSAAELAYRNMAVAGGLVNAAGTAFQSNTAWGFSGVSHVATGQYRLTFSAAQAGAGYGVLVTPQPALINVARFIPCVTSPTTTTFDVFMYDGTGAAVDQWFTVAVFGTGHA
jgi:hypothetical protein